MDPLLQFWDWFGDHGCFFLPEKNDTDGGLFNLNSFESMKRSINKLYWNPEKTIYAVSIKETKSIHDPMELLPSNNNKLTIYHLTKQKEIPEPECSIEEEEFLGKYPHSVKLI
jgi:hypothetical protein